MRGAPSTGLRQGLSHSQGYRGVFSQGKERGFSHSSALDWGHEAD